MHWKTLAAVALCAGLPIFGQSLEENWEAEDRRREEPCVQGTLEKRLPGQCIYLENMEEQDIIKIASKNEFGGPQVSQLLYDRKKKRAYITDLNHHNKNFVGLAKKATPYFLRGQGFDGNYSSLVDEALHQAIGYEEYHRRKEVFLHQIPNNSEIRTFMETFYELNLAESGTVPVCKLVIADEKEYSVINISPLPALENDFLDMKQQEPEEYYLRQILQEEMHYMYSSYTHMVERYMFSDHYFSAKGFFQYFNAHSDQIMLSLDAIGKVEHGP